jgi:hypothetical protein
MSSITKIEWTETTWNPTTGCDRISPRCDNCYALTLARRLKAMGSAKYQADGDPRTSGPGFAVIVHQDALWEPLRWRKPRVVFVNSMSDLFHARVPGSFVASVFGVMAMTPQHTYQVLTKRPRRMQALLTSDAFRAEVDAAADAAVDTGDLWLPSLDPVPWPFQPASGPPRRPCGPGSPPPSSATSSSPTRTPGSAASSATRSALPAAYGEHRAPVTAVSRAEVPEQPVVAGPLGIRADAVSVEQETVPAGAVVPLGAPLKASGSAASGAGR